MSDTIVRTEAPTSSHNDTGHLEGLTVYAAVSDRETQEALAEALVEIEGVVYDFAPLGKVPMAAIKSVEKSPDAFFFEARDEEQAVDWLEAVRASPGGFYRHLVVLLPSPTKTSTIRLLQTGADDVLSTRPDVIDITRTLVRARSAWRDQSGIKPTEGSDDSETRLIVFIHAAGGQGATTVAVNTAVQLQARVKDGHGGVCLIDFDMQFGDAHLQLDLQHHSRMMDLVNTPERLDRRMLDDLMINAPSDLKVLTAPDTPMPLDAISKETVDRILSLARRRYRYVVVDMPAALARWTETVLHKADHVFLVTQTNVPALRATRRLLDTIRDERVTRAPITIIANRISAKPGANRVSIQQAARAIDREIAVVLPNDYSLVMESLDSGVPVSTLRPSSKLAKAIGETIEVIIGAKDEAKRNRGLVRSLTKLGRK